MNKKTRIKAVAASFVCMDRDQADAAIGEIGRLQRERETIRTAMNTELAAAKERYEAQAAPLAEAIKELSYGIQIWAEAHRTELTRDGRIKTSKLGSGEVRWRTRPPSVAIRAVGIVIEALKFRGLERFIRTKEEIDREAILREPEAVGDIKGISISQGEDFVIVPFATELEEVA